jgi:hypothetical protein
MDAIKSLMQPLVGGVGGSSVLDGMKLVMLGGTVETARRVSSSAWSVPFAFLFLYTLPDDYYMILGPISSTVSTTFISLLTSLNVGTALYSIFPNRPFLRR